MRYLALIWNFFTSRRAAVAPRAKIEAQRNRQLRAMLAHAYDNSRYYRALYDSAGITRENLASVPLASLPTTDKVSLMKHFDEVVCDPAITRDAVLAFDEASSEKSDLFQGVYHVVHSSGSSGKPGYFIYDQAAWQQMILGIVRGALWGMSTLEVLQLIASRPRVLYVAAADGRYGGVMAVGDGVASLKMEQQTLDINTPISQWCETVKAFNPTVMIGYPSAIKVLADLLDSDEVQPSVRLVVSCGEPLAPGTRMFFEQVFDASVVNCYGASESLALGVEVDPAQGMILFDDLNWVEVHPDGMYLTSLYNFTQPLIRYKISDKLAVKQPSLQDSCSFTHVEGVLGRCEDLLWFDGDQGQREYLHPLAVEGFNVEGLHDYQFRKTSSRAFEMLAEVPDLERRNFVAQQMQLQMRPILKANGLECVSFNVEFVASILPDPTTGKKRLIVGRDDSQ